MPEEPRDYDRTYTKALSHRARIRMGYSTERGDVTRFVAQLEYNQDDEWVEVVRFDHDATGVTEHAHDVTTEGVHLDVYRDGEKYRTEEIFPPMPAGDLDDALEAYGVTVTTDDDGTPVYEDVPPELSLSACHLAVDLREDPSEFISTAAELV